MRNNHPTFVTQNFFHIINYDWLDTYGAYFNNYSIHYVVRINFIHAYMCKRIGIDKYE